MIEIDNIISKSILAGVAIGIGGFVSLSCSNNIISALLFSVGLWSVCIFKGNRFSNY